MTTERNPSVTPPVSGVVLCARCVNGKHTNPPDASALCECGDRRCGDRRCGCYGAQVRAGMREDRRAGL